MARPSKYTKKLGDDICVRLAGGESLRSGCRDDKMPALSTVLLWVVDGKHEDALKWGAERMSPKKHSPRQMIDHSSPDGSMTPQPTRIEIVAPNDNGKS